MGECHCSNITIMQLFHELKQQFPALPDHVVSQCIAQNSHDREICARSLRATQESRPSPGAFPPPAPCIGVQEQHHQLSSSPQQREQQRCCAMNQVQQQQQQQQRGIPVGVRRPHRPASLDIGMTRRCIPPVVGCIRATSTTSSNPVVVTPSSAPAACTSRGFFDDGCTVNSNGSNAPSGFELNVNVACSPAGNRDFRTVPTIGACKRTDLIVVPRPHYAEPIAGKSGAQIDHTRSYTSVSLTLRPPSSEPQPPIDIRSEGSSLTYSTSSLDPRGFQSRLQISIGPGNVGSVAAARIRPPMANSLLPSTQTSPQRPPGLPPGPPSQLPRPTTTTMSAPTTPSVPPTTNIVPICSLPTTPSASTMIGIVPPSSASVGERTQSTSDQNRSSLSQMTEHQKKLITEQLARKERLARELRVEKGRLEAMKKEVQALAKPVDPSVSPQELKKRLRSEIYMLQIECDRLADQVDQWSDRRVPLGETNEEFYQSIYTGQPLPTRPLNLQPPPLPSQPPVWRLEEPTIASDNERDGPSWVCTMCTFDNHPLMNKCEECDMPRLLTPSNSAGTVHGKSPGTMLSTLLLSSSSSAAASCEPSSIPLQPPGIE
ncbi:TGF-beta-activated kinase 1 and MAP3K7-binding protein 3 isoform X1 [Polyergus mexicanus]|uniref:TGF-beta-activated kinase 1 and MAP3K7-binding protein 3 isoform X1 n=1 Tax=Polyergus mexicanus TaxID=615972 RepID=UPI0038B495CB